LANRYRREKLETCRRLLGCAALAEGPTGIEEPEGEPCEEGGTAEATISCPACKTGRMRIIDTFAHISAESRRGCASGSAVPAATSNQIALPPRRSRSLFGGICPANDHRKPSGGLD
jgi:hypothetical protein